MNVLLVTGSRSLALRAGTQRAFCEHHRELIDQADLVVTGDAYGPDQWANWLAPFDYEQWQLGGGVRLRAGVRWWSSLKTNDPLVRNRCMVESVRDNYLRRGENVLCVGFVDPVPRTPGERRTRGTDHTLRLARQAGIWCARYVWQGERFEEQS